MSRRIVRLLVPTLLAFPAAAAAAPRLLVLPVVAEGVDAARSADVQAGLEAAVGGLPGLERVPTPGPTFCASSDEPCIAEAGRKAGATQVLYTAARPVGEALSVLLLLVPSGGGTSKKHLEAVGQGVAVAPVVRAGTTRLLAPERYVGALLVEAADGSELWLDGARVGVAPLSAPIGGITPGQHVLRVVRPGGAEARGYVEVRFDAVTRIRVEPRSDELAMAGFEGAGASAPAVAAIGPGPGPTGPAVAPRDDGLGTGWHVAKWSLLGVGVLALGGSAFFASEASTAQHDYEALRDELGRHSPGEAEARAALKAQAEDDGATATTLLFAGGAALAVSGAIFVVDAASDDDDGGGGAALSIAPAPGGASVGLSLSIP